MSVYLFISFISPQKKIIIIISIFIFVTRLQNILHYSSQDFATITMQQPQKSCRLQNSSQRQPPASIFELIKCNIISSSCLHLLTNYYYFLLTSSSLPLSFYLFLFIYLFLLCILLTSFSLSLSFYLFLSIYLSISTFGGGWWEFVSYLVLFYDPKLYAFLRIPFELWDNALKLKYCKSPQFATFKTFPSSP